MRTFAAGNRAESTASGSGYLSAASAGSTRIAEANVRSSGAVVALGAEATAAAALYAQLTGRPLANPCTSVTEIDPSRCAVVFTTSRHASRNLLGHLYGEGADSSTAPGLIFAPTESELIGVAEGIAGKLIDPMSDAPIIEVFANEPIGDQQIGGRRILGEDAGPETIHKAVTDPSAALSLITHSNGYDLYLGGGLSFCDSVERRGRSLDGAPCCQFTGECFRQHRPPTEAHGLGLIVTPDQIRARILVLYTCSGILGSVESRVWGYAQALLSNGHVAAVVVGWGLLVPVGRDLQRLLWTLYRGATVGEAVAAVNQCNPWSRMAILGDPSAGISRLSEEHISLIGYQEPDGELRGDGGRFLHVLCSEVAAEGPADAATLANLAASKVQAFERAANLGLACEGNSATAMRLVVLSVLAQVGHLLSKHWLPLTIEPERLASTPCAACGEPTDRLGFRFRSQGLSRRELLLCTHCGIRRDSPVGRHLDLRLQDGAVVLDGRLPHQEWSAILHVGSQARELDTIMAWPADERGMPCRSLSLPSHLPPGPLTFAFMIIEGVELAMVTTYMNLRKIDKTS